MATTSRVTPWGWDQGDDATNQSRVTPGGWEQVVEYVPPTTNPTLSLPTYVPGSLTSSAFRPRVTATWS